MPRGQFDGRSERVSAVFGKPETHVPTILAVGREPGHRNAFSLPIQRGAIHRASRDLPPIRVDQPAFAPALSVISGQGNVPHFRLRAIAIKSEQRSIVQTVKIGGDSGGKEIEYLLCQDEAALLYLANLGCIELNPWSSRLGTLDRPDFVVIDLDPREALFAHLVEAALEVRKVLEMAGCEGYPKTSGKSGLHIYIPLGARHRYPEAAQFAEILAKLVNFALPRSTSLERSPRKRIGRVYLDHLQNRQGQTIAAPYAVRPWPGATVSTPLEWKELKPGLDPSGFTIRTLPGRLERVGDLFRPVLGPGVDLVGTLDRLLRAVGRSGGGAGQA